MVENNGRRRLSATLERYQNLLKHVTDASVAATLSEMAEEVRQELRALKEALSPGADHFISRVGEKPSIIELPLGPTDRCLRDLVAYWASKKNIEGLPRRSAILPAEIVPMLPYIAVIDVVGEPPRFRFCRAGMALVAAYGENITGKFLDELDLGSIAPDIFSHIAKMVRQPCPQAVRVRIQKQTEVRSLEYERIGLPLSEAGDAVTAIMCGFAFG